MALKAENLQRTGSFKLRGALAKIAALGDACAAAWSPAAPATTPRRSPTPRASAGVRCEVFMPETAPIAKVEAATALGAVVHLGGATRRRGAGGRPRARRRGGLRVRAPVRRSRRGRRQGGLGLELLRQVPDIARVIVPVGGGGLVSGVAIAIKSQRPEVEVIGVQVETCAPFPASLAAGEPVAVDSALTIADGIAVKRPGGLTLALIERWVDEIVRGRGGRRRRGDGVPAGARQAGGRGRRRGRRGGAAPAGCGPAAAGTTVVVLSGGNVDAGLLAEIARRHESQAGRRLVLLARLPDRPGSLALLLALVGDSARNLLDVAAHPRGLRPARARDRGAAGARDARARARRAR